MEVMHPYRHSEVIPEVEGVQAFPPVFFSQLTETKGNKMDGKHLKRSGIRAWHYTKKIMGQLLEMIVDFPNTVVGIILALIIGLLLLSIPWVGTLLFFIVEPFLLIAFIVMFGSRDYRRN